MGPADAPPPPLPPPQAPALAKDRERRIDAIERPGGGSDLRRQGEVLVDGERRVDAAIVGDEAEAGPGATLRRPAADLLAAEHDPALHLAMETDKTAEGGRLSRSVPSDGRDELPVVDPERHLLQRLGLAVPRGETRDLKHPLGPGTRR